MLVALQNLFPLVVDSHLDRGGGGAAIIGFQIAAVRYHPDFAAAGHPEDFEKRKGEGRAHSEVCAEVASARLDTLDGAAEAQKVELQQFQEG